MRDKKITSKIMSSIKSKDTKPEILLRKALWRKGLRFRKNFKKLPGSPDIVFTKNKLAIFVDGDFWHGNNWKIRGLNSLSDEFSENTRKYWLNKIKNNIKRDRKNNRDLRKVGYSIIRVWESDLKKDIDPILNKINNKLQDLSPSK